ncbi:Lrp/AsnC ligand binding domain-containing protein [Desulfurococcaceae archaeon MEX13E-LK6-19]|nr:Lrp/AsnC ligand binding domain-containing protein [Desulfurococcaceae archaeon MEX13E-LK6-19]
MSEEKLIAYVLVVTSIGREHDVVKEVEKMDGVTEAVIVYGEYDVVVRIETNKFKEIDKIVTKIRSLPQVLRTVTLIGQP